MSDIVREEYVAPYYYRVTNRSDGSKTIYNGSSNYVMNEYDGKWDRERRYYIDDYGNERWEYTDRTVSGNGANINGGDGNDKIENNGDSVTISGGKGNDEIRNVFKNNYYGDNVSINGGADNDFICNDCSKVTIIGGDGDDTIFNRYADNTTISGGTGNDFIRNDAGSNVTIDGGADDDTISNGNYNGGHNVSINGGDGNDSIYNKYGYNIIIDGGEGKNTLGNGILEVHTEEVLSGYVHGVPMYKDILVASESVTGGNNVLIKSGSDDDVIQNVDGSKVTIDADGGKNRITLVGTGKSISVKSGAGNDSIFAVSFAENVHFEQEAHTVKSGSEVTINAGDGQNLISIGSGWSYVTVNSGDEKDIVINKANKAIIKTGALNDLVKNYGNYVTIDGGEDFDTIINFGSKVRINGGDGNRNSENYIYSDATNVTINGGKNDDRILVYNDIGASVNAGEGNDYIMLQRVQWKDILSSIVKPLTDAVDPKSLLEENVENVAVDFSKDWLKKNLLNESFGTLLESVNKVSGTIQKYADWFNIIEGYYKKTSDTTTVIGGKGNDIIVNDGVASRVFEYSDGDGNDTIYYFNTNKALKANLNLDAQSLFLPTLHIKKGLVKEVALDGNDVIVKVGKGSIRLIDGVGKKFKLREADGYTTTRAYDRNSDSEVICTIFGTNKNEELWDKVGFKKQSYVVSPGDPTPKDKIIGTVNKNVIYGNGGKDTIRANDKNSSLYGGSSDDLLYGGDGADYLNGESGNDTLIGGTGNNTLLGGSGKDSLIGGVNNDSILGGTGNDTLWGGKGKDTLDGESGNDKLFGGTGNDTLWGSGGKDTLSGEENNDRLYGGDGNDSLNGGDGDDKLYGELDNDKLLGGAGDDVLYGGFGKDTLSGGADNDKLFGETGDDSLSGGMGDDYLDGSFGNDKLFGDKGDDTLSGSFDNDTLDGGEDNDKLFGDSGNDSLQGGDGADTLDGGVDNDKLYGGAGNDSLNGGKGNDSLWGNVGDDIFDYKFGDGKDIIYGFENNDLLKITGTFSVSYSKKNNAVTFTVGEGSITLKKFTATIFHVNNDIYQISDSKFVKQK